MVSIEKLIKDAISLTCSLGLIITSHDLGDNTPFCLRTCAHWP